MTYALFRGGDPQDRITDFEDLWNDDPEPFEWTYTRDDLTRLLERLPTIE